MPKYNEMYVSLLNTISDGQLHKVASIRNSLAQHYELTEEERKQLTPSGNMLLFDNRVGWAITYLRKANFIASSERGVISITTRGKKALNEKVAIDNNYLSNFRSFTEFIQPKKKPISIRPNSSVDTDSQTQTPEELMDTAYEKISMSLVDEILTEVVKMSPFAFERLVVQLLLAMGYGNSLSENGLVTKKSGDEGIDGIIKEDKLGFDNIYIQAKCWKIDSIVGRGELQKFTGALAGQKATKGLFITTAKFSKDALSFPNNLGSSTKIVLIDGTKLAKLMIEHNLGVSISNTYIIRRIDSDYFSNL